jgi:spore germination protein YaaH
LEPQDFDALSSNRSKRTTSHTRRRNGSHRRKKRKKFPIGCLLIIIIFLVAIVSLGTFVIIHFSPTKEKANLNNYFNVSNKNEIAITANNQVLKTKGKLFDGKIYIPIDTIVSDINNRFYYDETEQILLYTLPDEQIQVGLNTKDYMVSLSRQSSNYIITRKEGNTLYVALDFIKQYSNITYSVYNNPNRVVILNGSSKVSLGTIKKDAPVRVLGGIKSPILTTLKKDAKVVILHNETNWSKVSTSNGFVGYIKKSQYTSNGDGYFTSNKNFKKPVFEHNLLDKKVNLVWDNVTNTTANNNLVFRLRGAKGINVIAPTWLSLANTSGGVTSIASKSYVNTAHQKGLKVWPTLRDFDGGIKSNPETYNTLKLTSNRKKIISTVVSECTSIGADGINLDFEMVGEKGAAPYIQFIRELSVSCKDNNLVLSVDNYVPKEYNAHYNRKEQGNYADYVVIMGYDEYFAGSTQAGPVSSYGYVKDGIEATLKDVDNSQVISGVAFFSRLWEEKNGSVSSKALSMEDSEKTISTNGGTLSWDDAKKLNYASWEKNGATYKIWLEDSKSIEYKVKLVDKYNLAGGASWSLGQGSDKAWDVISKYLN